MGMGITDKIRKIHDADQTVRSGPKHAGVYVDSNGNLMININETDGPQQVDALEGDTLSAVKTLAQENVSIYDGAGAGIAFESNGRSIWIGAHFNDDGELIADADTVLQIERIEDSGGAVQIVIYINQVAGQIANLEETSKGLSFTMENLFFGNDPVEHGTPKNFVAAGAVAGDVTVTGVGANDLLVSVIVFTAGVPSDLTAEFSITADDTINNTGGTSTATKSLIVSVLSRT